MGPKDQIEIELQARLNEMYHTIQKWVPEVQIKADAARIYVARVYGELGRFVFITEKLEYAQIR